MDIAYTQSLEAGGRLDEHCGLRYGVEFRLLSAPDVFIVPEVQGLIDQ